MSGSTATGLGSYLPQWSWLPWATTEAKPAQPKREAQAPPSQSEQVDRSRKGSRLAPVIMANPTTQAALNQPSADRRVLDEVPGAERQRAVAPTASAIPNYPVRVPPEVRVTSHDVKRLVQSGTRDAPALALESGRAVQRLLNASGANLEVDGRLGPRFRQALADFRKGHNLGKGTSLGTGLDQATLDALVAGSRQPHDRGRTFTGFEAGSPRQRAAGNMLALLQSQDPQRFEKLLKASGVQMPRSGALDITPAIADKVIRAIENPPAGHGIPFDEQARSRLAYGTTQHPNGEWSYEAAQVAADVAIPRTDDDRREPPVLSRELQREIYSSELLRRTAALEGVPLNEAQALIATESDGLWKKPNKHGATGYTQVTAGLANEYRIINDRMTYVGPQYRGPGTRVNINNKEHNLRLGFAARMGHLYNVAARHLDIPAGSPRSDRAMAAVDAGYNAGIGRLNDYVGTPNFRETRNQIWQIRAYMQIFGNRNDSRQLAAR